MLQLICPHCHAPLSNLERQWRCPAGHSYDQARQGYLNLLLVQFKNSKQPGDTPQMLACRQAFLDAGHYQPVSDAINQLFAEFSPPTLLDMGCGEGYYTERLARALPDTAIGGFDISKDAIIRACRRSRSIRWMVASSARLPVADQSLDAALSVFSPWSADECLRTVKPGGRVLIVGPHSDHLLALRERLYDQIHPTPALIKALPDGLRIASEQTLRYPLQLTSEDLGNLIGMTPHGVRSRPERQQAIAEQGIEGLEVAMQMIMLERC
ncbi:SAM-dependent methyltransferase [Halopseudomonas aestusnigri]|uniref:putative RNA methyltransferase n=1 Tax=Halopseudomonas TaxID=2901189 RepID=UPI0022B6151C|nr:MULTISPECIES: methyltransferase domain-containing protein [Halopseudomonas]BDX19055.1 SAM-dependent methyltransferase [Halopseudomonas aestusnigri]